MRPDPRAGCRRLAPRPRRARAADASGMVCGRGGGVQTQQPSMARPLPRPSPDPRGLRGPVEATVPSTSAMRSSPGSIPAKRRIASLSYSVLRYNRSAGSVASRLNPWPSDRSAHTSSARSKPEASSPGTSAGARPSAPPSDDAARSAPERDPTAPPRSALRPNRWRLRLTLSQKLLAPRPLLLHRIAKDRKGGLLRHGQGSLRRCQSLPDHAESGRFFRRSSDRNWPIQKMTSSSLADAASMTEH